MISSIKKILDLLPETDRFKLIGLMGLMFIGTILEVAGIGMLPVFVSAVSDPSYILDNEYVGPIATQLGLDNSTDLLIYGGIALVSVFLLKTLYLIWFNYIKAKFVYNRYAFISSRLFEKYLSAPYTFHLDRNTSELIRNVTNEARFISHQMMLPMLTIFMESITVTGILVLLAIVEPGVTVVSFLLIGGGGGLALRLIKKRLRYYGKQAGIERGRLIQGVTEGIGGYKDITVMNRSRVFIERFKGYLRNLTQAEIFKGVSTFASRPVIEFIAVAGMVFIAGFMIWQGRPIASIIPVLALFGAAVVRLIPSASQIIMQLTNLKYYHDSLNIVHEDIIQNEELSSMKISKEKINRKLSFGKKMVIKNVQYSYPRAIEPALKGVNLEIRKGSAVGFVGESGAGKSTIVDVILGLLEPQKGQILVDGIDISDKMRMWQNNIGYIPQFIYLSDDTIRNNIAFGLSEDEISDNKLNEAIKAAQLEKVLKDLPEGLNTIIGEDGVRLSGGQRQRIGIARALYNNPAVLIMDEATSALDNVTEKNVISSIEALKGERTIIMIAHRLTTVQNCDKLFLMNNGKVIDSGTYEELIEKNAEFKKMSITN